MLTLYRRHSSDCPHSPKGRTYLRCKCPLWVDGPGFKDPRSLKTRSLEVANRKKHALEAGDKPEPEAKDISRHVELWLEGMVVGNDRAENTIKKYTRDMKIFTTFCQLRGVKTLNKLNLEDMDHFKVYKKDYSINSLRGLFKTVKTFLKFAKERNWIKEIPMLNSQLPKNNKPSERTPYTPEELAAILQACDAWGKATPAAVAMLHCY